MRRARRYVAPASPSSWGCHRLVTAGGRVLTITGVGDSLDEAHGRSLAYAREVLFKGKQFRSDIGWRELVRRAGTP